MPVGVQACAGADVGLVFVGGSMVELNKNGEGAFKPATEGEGLGKSFFVAVCLPVHRCIQVSGC